MSDFAAGLAGVTDQQLQDLRGSIQEYVFQIFKQIALKMLRTDGEGSCPTNFNFSNRRLVAYPLPAFWPLPMSPYYSSSTDLFSTP